MKGYIPFTRSKYARRTTGTVTREMVVKQVAEVVALFVHEVGLKSLIASTNTYPKSHSIKASRYNSGNIWPTFGEGGVMFEDLYLMQLDRCGGTAEVVLAVPTPFDAPFMLVLGEASSM